MKALVSALALLSFVGAVTLPAVAHAQTATSAPVKKKAVHHKAKKATKKAVKKAS